VTIQPAVIQVGMHEAKTNLSKLVDAGARALRITAEHAEANRRREAPVVSPAGGPTP